MTPNSFLLSNGQLILPSSLQILNSELIACERCPRLIAHCRNIAQVKRRAYMDHKYWGRPVPGFGDPHARLLLLGLAPGAHGSNRTGRMFTGDASGDFLYPVLHETGFASQTHAKDLKDGMKLHDAYITACARCAPPDNKPSKDELTNCSYWLDRELDFLKNVQVVVALGKIAFDGYLSHQLRQNQIQARSGFKFAHAAQYELPNGQTLLASYHPSQQNTLTGRLTRPMFLNIFRTARKLLNK